MRFTFSQFLIFWELDQYGNRVAPLADFTDLYIDHNDISMSIQKSITSNSDTADVEIVNHPILEQMYRDKLAFFQKFNEKQYEADILFYWRCGDDDVPDNSHTHCIFSGDVTDIYPKEDSSITDQSLNISCVGGKRASARAIINKKYAAGTPYLVIVQDIFNDIVGYQLTTIDDPFNKLNKVTAKSRTFHGKAVTLLNSIATDLEMTWGFDANPWQPANIATQGLNEKHCYWVDKRSVFDVAGINGTAPLSLNGSTGKTGRIGYSKSQVSFGHRSDPMLNIGRHYKVSDAGTMDDFNEFDVRINRLTISDQQSQLEGYYIGDDGLAVIEEDKGNRGAFIL